MSVNKKVAFIIPAYNAAKNIPACLNSILSQSYRNLAVYVVDDGSGDETVSVVSSFAERDNRVHLISIENSGPAIARNEGLKLVGRDADYIMFSDADDELLPDAVEKLVNLADDSGAQLVFAGFLISNPDGTENTYSEPSAFYSGETFAAAFGNLYKANLLNQVWAKLFSSELIFGNGLSFQDYRWGEDRLFIFDCIEHASSFSVLSDCVYKYIMHPGESLISGFYDKKADVCVFADQRAQFLCKKFSISDDGFFRYMFSKSIYSCLANLFSPSCHLTKSEKKDYVRSVINNPDIIARCKGASGGAAVKTLIFIMSTGNVSLNLLSARLVAFLGNALPGVFQKIKHKK